MKKSVLLYLAILAPVLSFSQGKWEGGPFLGYSNYLGDMVDPTLTLDQANFAGGVFLRNHLSHRFGLRGNLLFGKVEGADANYERLADRGASFKSSLIELSLMGEYEFFGHRRWTPDGQFKKTISPYIFGGAGLSYFNPDFDLAQDRPTPGKAEDLLADPSKAHFSLPLGGGIKFDLNQKVNLGLELGMRFTFTDYIDGISLGGDPNDNDVYIFGGLVAGFKLGNSDSDNDGVADDKDPCPTVPGPVALSGCPDADADGLADRDDNCPNEAGETRLLGCPDRDGDGVSDNLDDCPNDAGIRRFSGCPDTDNDNIVDKEDLCPMVAGIPSMNGCPDSDRDGISNAEDKCPDEPGVAVFKGCPDTDNDGISDDTDNCPTVPGPAVSKGCPDTDRDGTVDADDDCPTIPGPVTSKGCPEIKKEDKATLDLAMKNVQFETGSAKLLRSSLTNLDQIVALMGRYPGYKMVIDGYTDNVGNDFVNQQLSEQRAKACLDYLVGKGLSASTLSSAGHGENDPVATNDTAAGRQQNRRVEFTLKPL